MGQGRLGQRVRQGTLCALLWAVPPRGHAVVAGFPDDEGNSVEVVRALARRCPVYWLTSDDPAEVDWLVGDTEHAFPVHVVRKDSVRAYAAYISARYIFFTHGLYGSPPPPPRKTVVNLWHGDGPKMTKGFARVRSTYVVAGTRLWGQQRPQKFPVAADAVLVTGNPRIDEFARPADDATLRRLGLDPDRPLVLWMPTYRRTDYRGRRMAAVRNWSDAPELSGSGVARELFGSVARLADRQGLTVAVKPHPLDADRYQAMGLPVITGADLRRERTTTYRLLARTRGLITDYSSVWTDYLALDRPIGFHCPDVAEFERGRGLNVADYPDIIAGPLLRSADEFERFLLECREETADSRARRTRSVQLVGAETRMGANERLLDAVGVPRGVGTSVLARRGESRKGETYAQVCG